LSIVKNGWGLIIHRYISFFNNILITGSILAMLPSIIEGNLYGCPRPHMQFKGRPTLPFPLFGKGRVVEGKREPTLPLPLFGKVEEEYCG